MHGDILVHDVTLAYFWSHAVVHQHLERLDGCHPIIQGPVRYILAQCEATLHRTLLIVCGWRSLDEQLLNYQKGRVFNRETGVWDVSDATLIVTRAKPGTSSHNIVTRDGRPASLAVDLVPLLSSGLPNWDVDDRFWDDLYRICWHAGMDPLGDALGQYLPGDKGHIEEPGLRLKLDGLGVQYPALLPVAHTEV